MLICFFLTVYSLWNIYNKYEYNINVNTTDKFINTTIIGFSTNLRSNSLSDLSIIEKLEFIKKINLNSTYHSVLFNSTLNSALIPSLYSTMLTKSYKCTDNSIENLIKEFLTTLIELTENFGKNFSTCLPTHPIKTAINCQNNLEITNLVINLFKTITLNSNENCIKSIITQSIKYGNKSNDQIEKDFILSITFNSLNYFNNSELNNVFCNFIDFLMESIDEWTNNTNNLICKSSKIFKCPQFSQIDLEKICSIQNMEL